MTPIKGLVNLQATFKLKKKAVKNIKR